MSGLYGDGLNWRFSGFSGRPSSSVEDECIIYIGSVLSPGTVSKQANNIK